MSHLLSSVIFIFKCHIFLSVTSLIFKVTCFRTKFELPGSVTRVKCQISHHACDSGKTARFHCNIYFWNWSTISLQKSMPWTFSMKISIFHKYLIQILPLIIGFRSLCQPWRLNSLWQQVGRGKIGASIIDAQQCQTNPKCIIKCKFQLWRNPVDHFEKYSKTTSWK